MARETMTLQEAIAVVSDMLSNHLRTPDDIAVETLLAHARATTAGTVRDPMTREQIYEEFRAGNTDLPNFGAVLVDDMADEIIRLRTTAGTGAGGGRVVCERCRGTGFVNEFFTSGPMSGGVRYVACGCGAKAVIVKEYTSASLIPTATGAGGVRVTDANLGRIWSLIRDAVKVAARKNTDAMTYEQESAFLDALAADTEQKVAALAPQGVTDAMKVTEAMLQAGARTMARKYAARCGHDERDVWAIYGNDFRDDARDVLTAALAASARGAA